MKKIVFLMLVILTACQNRPKESYNQELAAWLGQTQWALFRKWGQPDEQFAIDMDTYVVTYNRFGKKPIEYNREPYKNMMKYKALAGPEYGYSQYPQIWYCKTTFTLRNDIVVDYSFNGDDCI